MKTQMMSIIEPRLSNAQHGFRRKRSVTTNLLSLSILTNESFEKQCQLDTFYGDYKSAFDSVCHRLLIEKLSKYSVGPKTAKCIYEFVIQMKYYVQIGQNKSRIYTSTSGIIPGSVLGPILFLIFIDDVVEVVESAFVLLFADDIKMSKIIYDWVDVRKLQVDINNVNEWCVRNRLFFNKKKCAIFTAYRTTSFIEATYVLDGHKQKLEN